MNPSGGVESSPPSAPLADTDDGAEVSTPPVIELADLAVEPSAEFVRRIRRRIHRRVLTSQVVDLSSAGVWRVAIEFLGMAFGLAERVLPHEDARRRRDAPGVRRTRGLCRSEDSRRSNPDSGQDGAHDKR